MNNHLQHKKEKPYRVKISDFSAWKFFKITFQMRNLTHRGHRSGHFPSKLGHFFPIFEKVQVRPPPLPPLVTHLILKHCVILTGKHLFWGPFLIKLQPFKIVTLLEKDSNMYFLVNMGNLMRTLILKNFVGRLFLHCCWKVLRKNISHIITW